MADIDNVIKELERIYEEEHKRQVYADAIALLKEQEKEIDEISDEYLDLGKEMAKQPKPKTGHWIEKEDGNLDTYYDCSACGESWTTVEGTPWQNGMNYCPHCGAKMRKEFAWDKFPDTIC